jgi:hypothetical protein
MMAQRPSRAWLLGVTAGLLMTSGCSNSTSEGARRFRYAEAVEVPAAVAERDQLAAMLAGFANRNGLAYRDSSPRMQRVSNGHQTVAFQIDRPLTNGRLWTEMQVSAVGNEAVLITFAEPLDKGIKADSDRGRAEILSKLRQRWPATAVIELQADGGLPREWRRQVRFD